MHTKEQEEEQEKALEIVILQRGFVMIGFLSKKENDCTLTDAYVIRSWGTSRGLGELALEGKKENTLLDKAGLVELNNFTIIARIKCDYSKWKSFYEEKIGQTEQNIPSYVPGYGDGTGYGYGEGDGNGEGSGIRLYNNNASSARLLLCSADV